MLKNILLAFICFPQIGFGAIPEVDRLIGLAIQKKTLPGAVTAIGTKERVMVRAAYGRRDQQIKNNLDTIYDIASLTKVVATATAIMILEEQGKLSLKDKVALYFPEFNSPLKHEITLEDLMLHHSGLASGMGALATESYQRFISRIAGSNLVYQPKSKTVYSDLGFLLLGRVVELTSGMTLDQFSQTTIFSPLKMSKTGYFVATEFQSACAPTSKRKACLPHDPKAFQFYPNNTGHAGIFSTSEDLSRFARMILNDGTFDGVQVMKKETVKKMTQLTSQERALGWDILSSYSNPPRGSFFPKGISFGHTGYTGTTIWIDPKSESFYIFLSNRVLLGEDVTAGPFTELRRNLSTAIGKAIYESSSRFP